MGQSDSIKELTAALAKAQIAFKPIKRTEQVDYATTSGRKKYNYAPLSEVIEAIKQSLSDNGLTITQSTKLVNENTILETFLSHISGEWRGSEMYVGKQDQPPQLEGSALSYKRRYSISAMLCLASEEDDDAETASGRGQAKPETKPEPKTQEPKTQVEKHWCAEHNVAYRTMHSKDGKSEWYSHKKPDGSWCNEKKEAKVEKVESTTEVKKAAPQGDIPDTEIKELGFTGADVKVIPQPNVPPDAPQPKSQPPKEQSDSKPQGTPQEDVMADLKILVNRKPQIWTIDKTITELKKLGGVGATVTLAVQSLPPDKLKVFREIVKKVLPKED